MPPDRSGRKRKRQNSDVHGQNLQNALTERTWQPQPGSSQQNFNQISAHDHSRQYVGNVYNNYYDESDDVRKASRIMQSLHFPEIDRRRNAVSYNANHTFSWLLNLNDAASAEPETDDCAAIERLQALRDGQSPESEWSKRRGAERRYQRQSACQRITTWLGNDESLFWISGKPASGKTTLMKFLRNSDLARMFLQRWASGVPLIIADHYFWYPGTDLQKSHEGLYRTLLYQILMTDTQLAKIACPERWSGTRGLAEPWNEQSFYRAMENLCRIDLRICLFVDRLDEYCPPGDHPRLLESIMKLSKLRNIKLCVSSRTWPIFQERLRDANNQLRLEDLNYIDIENYALDKLTTAAAGPSIKRHFQRPMTVAGINFVERLVSTANGVFLWAVLVMRRLTGRMRVVQDLKDLNKCLTTFPSELSTYFKELLYDRINCTWTECSETAATLAIALASRKHASLSAYWHLPSGRAMGDPRFGETQRIMLRSTSWINEMNRKTADFISECCGDLLCVKDSGSIYAQYWGDELIVEFAHRTVIDFLFSEEMQALLCARLPPHLVDERHLRGQLALSRIKIARTDLQPMHSYQELAQEISSVFSSCHYIRNSDNQNDANIVFECDRVLLVTIEVYAKFIGFGYDCGPHETILCALGWWCSNFGLENFINCMDKRYAANQRFQAAVLCGALGINPPAPLVVRPKDVLWPLEISLTNVIQALDVWPHPNTVCSIISDRPSSSLCVPTGRTTWHEFLMKWVRTVEIDMQKDFNFLRNNQDRDDVAVNRSNDKCPAGIDLWDLEKKRGMKLWEVAKTLIQYGASLEGQCCLEETYCCSSTYTDVSFEEFELRSFAHIASTCSLVNVMELLEELVPEECRADYEETVKIAKQKKEDLPTGQTLTKDCGSNADISQENHDWLNEN